MIALARKNYQNLIIGFQVKVENVGDASFETQCKYVHLHHYHYNTQ